MEPPFADASRLGFGCASLGSRVNRRDGKRGLSEAFDAQVNWFDVAPSYGDGEAELILAEFLRGRRDRCFVCTKVGLQPGRVGRLGKSLRPIARAVVRLAPSARAAVAIGRSGPMAFELTRASILRSIEASLTRLKTDFVDVFALHDPSPEDVLREEVVRALQDILASGKARAIGVAGDIPAITAAVASDTDFGVFQFPAGQIAKVENCLAGRSRPPKFVTHSVSALDIGLSVEERLERSLVENSDGVVLMSMYSPAHISNNINTLRSIHQK